MMTFNKSSSTAIKYTIYQAKYRDERDPDPIQLEAQNRTLTNSSPLST
jgi:hypothetical protein